jgi:uncharacterized protein YdaU (DUF1376 family)
MTGRPRGGMGPRRFGATDRAPYFAFYAKEWLLLTMHLTPEQRGAFITLLARAWSADEPCALPDNEVELAKLAGVKPARWRTIGPGIREMFDAENGRLVHAGLRDLRARMIESSEKRAVAGRRGAEKRHGRGVTDTGTWPSTEPADGSNAMAMLEHTDPDQHAHGEADAHADPDVESPDDVSSAGQGKEVDHWVEQIAAVWMNAYRGQVPHDKVRRGLTPLVTKCGIDTVVRRFKNYCASVGAQYASIDKFASTFGEWERERRARAGRHDVDMVLGLDEPHRGDGRLVK